MFLTICIPTYNRANELDFLLNELVKQISFNKFIDVAICVADNSDNIETQSIIEEKYNTFNYLHYKKNRENLGAFGNLMEVTQMINSRYVWVLGDDDYITPNAIKLIRNKLKEVDSQEIGFIFLNACGFNSDLSQIVCSNESKNIETTIYPAKDISLYETFSFNSLGHFSRLIFNQKIWLDCNPIYEREIFEIYPQIKSILKISSNHSVLFYSAITVINARRATNASEAWAGYGGVYWAYEFIKLLNIGISEYGYSKQMSSLKYGYINKILLSYLKINVQKDFYSGVIDLIKKNNSSNFYRFLMKPIEILTMSSLIRSILKRFGERAGIKFHEVKL